jgi:putative ABC transport system permease protein
MVALKNQNELGGMLAIFKSFGGVLIIVFLSIMSIVLWNAGLMGSLRRYGEIGLRLAVGESKGHVYRSMLIESVLLGIMGSILGMIVGLAASYYLQVKGIDFSSMMKNTTMLMSDVMRTRVTPTSYFIGFIPGVFATLLGTSIAGIGVYKRQTSQLFKELEV